MTNDQSPEVQLRRDIIELLASPETSSMSPEQLARRFGREEKDIQNIMSSANFWDDVKERCIQICGTERFPQMADRLLTLARQGDIKDLKAYFDIFHSGGKKGELGSGKIIIVNDVIKRD